MKSDKVNPGTFDFVGTGNETTLKCPTCEKKGLESFLVDDEGILTCPDPDCGDEFVQCDSCGDLIDTIFEQQVDPTSLNNFYFAGHDMGTLRGVDYSLRKEMYQDAMEKMYEELLTPPCKGFIWQAAGVRCRRCLDRLLGRLDLGDIEAAKEILRLGDMEYYHNKAKSILEAEGRVGSV